MAARGIRNNNPGNIEYGRFARKMGATGSDGRFAKFPTPEDGIRAIVTLQQRYEGDGLETVRQRISRWAPAGENDVDAYANAVAARMGIDPDTPFSINDPVLGTAFIDGMIQHENGRQPYSTAQIQSGHARAVGGGAAGPNIPAIMDVASRNTAPSAVPDAPTAAQGFAPSFMPSPAPAQTAIADLLTSPPTTPPAWAGNTSFPPTPPEPYQRLETVAGWMPQFAQPYDMPRPIDDALSGASPQDVLSGGPRLDPRRGAAASPLSDMAGLSQQDTMLGGNMPPMPSAMDQGVGILPPIPTPRPGGAPSPDMLGAGPNLRPASLSPVRPSMPNTTDQSAGYLPPIPQMRPGGAPDASLVPMPPSRALGIPNPPPRPSTTFGPGTAIAGEGMGAEAFGPQIGVNQPPTAGGESYTPFVSQPSPYDDWTRAFDIPGPFTRAQEKRDANPWPEPWSPTVAGRPEFPGNLAAAPPLDFNSANPDLDPPPMWSDATSFPPPPAPNGTVGAGSTGGEFFTPGGWPEALPNPFAPRFNDAFTSSAPSQVMDLQTAFDRRNAPPMISPPTMTAQDGITAAFGAPLARAEPPPPNLAIPFAEVPGFDMGRFENMAPAPPSITMGDFDQRFAGGSVVAPPAPGTPGVVQGTMPAPVEAGPIDIRSQAQGGPAYTPPMPGPPSPPTSPRMSNPGAERQRAGIGARVLGGIFGGPIGALGGGLFDGGSGGVGFGAPASFAWSGGGSAPYGNGGSTSYQKGTSNALGGSNALTWTGSKGQTVTVVQDPFTGTYMTAF